MNEIIRINLDNEMDLILAHKRTMKLGELCGLSISSQTTFATAVSEIARCAISIGKQSHLILGINKVSTGKKEIVASIFDVKDLCAHDLEAFSFARRLMGDLQCTKNGEWYEVRLKYLIPFGGTISEFKIKSFKEYFKNASPISPYDEIRKKNLLLIDLADRLQESERQYRKLTDTLPLMMFSINNKGKVTYANKWLHDFFGLAPSQVGTATWQTMVHPDDNKKIWKEWDKSVIEKTVFRAEGRLRDKEDKYIWHLITIVPIKNELDVITSSIGFFVDINSQKLVEETLKDNIELKDAKKELQIYQHELEQKIGELNFSNENLEQFAFIASHDLQEPLRKIKTFANLLETDLIMSDKQARYFDKIQDSATRMSNLIRDVLNYSKLAEKNNRYEPTDLNLVLKTILVDLELLIEEKNAKIVSGKLPVIKAIPLQITQLFSNLIHNSIKFCEHNPHLEITCSSIYINSERSVPELNPLKEYLHLKFRDNGKGFDQQYSKRIFTIFQRLGDKELGGTGIGLALCKKIVENHGGIINAESAPGQGATFNIYLPVEASSPINSAHAAGVS